MNNIYQTVLHPHANDQRPLMRASAVHAAVEFWPEHWLLRWRFVLADGVRLLLPPALAEPVSGVAPRQDNLWQHTCGELFVGDPNSPGYREFNFSPKGAWAVYDFVRYRQAVSGAPQIPAAVAPRMVWRDSSGCLSDNPPPQQQQAATPPAGTAQLSASASWVGELAVHLPRALLPPQLPFAASSSAVRTHSLPNDEPPFAQLCAVLQYQDVQPEQAQQTKQTEPSASGEMAYFARVHPAERPDFHHRGAFTRWA